MEETEILHGKVVIQVLQQQKSGTVKALKVGTATITATSGSETSSCTVNVVYENIKIGGNGYSSISEVNLVLSEHNSEKLFAKVKDGKDAEVSNANVTWKSSDTSIVTVNNGTITAVKPGTATITASAAGVTATCKVNVYAAPVFADFSNAKYENSIDTTYNETLKITNVKFGQKSDASYHYIITSSNTKPNVIKKSNGEIDLDAMKNSMGNFLVNEDENYMYVNDISKYTELNQDIYVWIIQQTGLEKNYYDESGNYISYSTKFVVEGKKITRAELKSVIRYFSVITTQDSENTSINFNFPSNTENRKFNIKIGKVTDNSILSKIKNNDYTGIKELLTYAKNNDSVYSQTLTTTRRGWYESNTKLLDGRKLLKDDSYYYVYVKFDDENGKYYPIEGVTLAQAILYSTDTNDGFSMYAYTDSNFKWNNEMSSAPEANKGEDNTTAKGNLPQTGVGIGLTVTITLVIAGSVFVYNKYRKLKGI